MKFKAKVFDSSKKTIEIEVCEDTKKSAIAVLKNQGHLILEMVELDLVSEETSRKNSKQNSKIQSDNDTKTDFIDHELTASEIFDKLQIARSKGNDNATVWAKEM